MYGLRSRDVVAANYPCSHYHCSAAFSRVWTALRQHAVYRSMWSVGWRGPCRGIFVHRCHDAFCTSTDLVPTISSHSTTTVVRCTPSARTWSARDTSIFPVTLPHDLFDHADYISTEERRVGKEIER